MSKLGTLLEKEVSITVAIPILIMFLVVIITTGIIIGNTYFWDKYENITKTDFDLRLAKANLAKNPNSPQAHIDLGWVYVKQKKYDMALQEYNRALSLDENNLDARYNIALVKLEIGHVAEAKKISEEIKKTNPDYLTNRATLGYIYTRVGDYEKALEEYNYVKKTLPADSDLLYQYGQLYEKMGEKEKAIASYKESLKYNPGFSDAKKALEKLEKK